jgi:hypothetical protein
VKPLAIVTLVLTASFATSARAQLAAPPPSPELAPVSPAREGTWREGTWRVEAGYRGSFVPTSSYQAFSNNGYLPEFSLSVSHTLLGRGPFSVAGGLAWGYGGSDASVRQVDPTHFSMQRLMLTVEGRLDFGRWGYAYLRAAPGAAFEKAEVDDAGSPAPLETNAWLFATDLSAGYAWLAWTGDGASPIAPRLWLQGEGGYGWVNGEHLVLEPALPSGSPIRTASVDLGTLAMQGGFFRVAAAVSF